MTQSNEQFEAMKLAEDLRELIDLHAQASVTVNQAADFLEALAEAAPTPKGYQGPVKFAPEEVANGNCGIRWVTETGVGGRPTSHDVMEYLIARNGEANCECSECKAFYSPTPQGFSWTDVGRLIEANNAARAAGLLSGTSNWGAFICKAMQAPTPPPECKTEAEKTAFAFGWFKAQEAMRAAPQEVDAFKMPDDKELFTYINKNPILQSLLYDINLLPEQIRNSTNWSYLVAICTHFQALDAVIVASTPPTQPADRRAPAKQKYDALQVEQDESDPVERLRAFCSIAMNGQDWLDVEPLFDAIKAAQPWGFTDEKAAIAAAENQSLLDIPLNKHGAIGLCHAFMQIRSEAQPACLSNNPESEKQTGLSVESDRQAQPVSEPSISRVFMLCDAYESGVGHGLAGDGLDDAKHDTFANPEHGEAYRIGYREGRERASRRQNVAKVSEPVEPVAWAMQRTDGLIMDVISPDEHAREEGGYTIPLYTSPQREPNYSTFDDLVREYEIKDTPQERLCLVFFEAGQRHHSETIELEVK